MTGIEILAVGEIGVGGTFNWWSAIAGGLFIGLVVGFIGAATEDNIGFSIVLFIVTALISGTLVGIGDAKPTHYVPTYKVVISDGVSMNDFMDKYEILEQDGKIYTVKERDNNNAS